MAGTGLGPSKVDKAASDVPHRAEYLLTAFQMGQDFLFFPFLLFLSQRQIFQHTTSLILSLLLHFLLPPSLFRLLFYFYIWKYSSCWVPKILNPFMCLTYHHLPNGSVGRGTKRK